MKLHNYILLFIFLIINSLFAQTPAGARMESWERHVRMRDETPYAAFKWKAIGPAFQGGRIETIACRPDRPSTIFMGAGSGNLWRSENNGHTWQPIFDHESTFTIGCVAVSPSHPDNVWVGTGEVLMARSSFSGTGIFKSTNNGETWQYMGLPESHHIARVVVHPENPDIVYAAVQGHMFTENPERGLYRTVNGGKTWERILYTSPRVGCVEVVLSPDNPEQVYAVMWERDRFAWNHTAYGPGSGLYRSDDGGLSWTRLKKGLPAGPRVGRYGIAVAPSNPDIVYALLDNHYRIPDREKQRRIGGEVYRSTDRGSTWKKTHKKSLPTVIGYDFCLIRVSPDNPDQIYVLGNYLLISDDAGKSFTRNQGDIVHLRPHESKILHLDHHDLWIDPENADRLLLGTDGGLYHSYDRGKTWLHLNNIPIAEAYAVNVDSAVPYNIYFGNQDNAALFGPASDSLTATNLMHWRHVYLDPWGGGDSYFTPADPLDPDIIYYEHQFGVLRRKHMATGETIDIMPDAAAEDKPLRRNWMTPFFISKWNPLTLYYGANRLYKSVNRGNTWQCISPDLTTCPESQGNIPWGTITMLSESPLQFGLILAGTDDGKVQLTQNDGKTWTDISSGLPGKWVSRVIASRHDSARIYVTCTGYREDDITPFVFISDNLGLTWRSITGDLPSEPVNVIREDPRYPATLYLGTDLGVYITGDGGKHWHFLGSGLPTTPVHDLMVQPRALDLVLASHGRGIFVLDISGIGPTPNQ